MAREKNLSESKKKDEFPPTPSESGEISEKGRVFPELLRSRGKYRNSKKFALFSRREKRARSREKSVEVLLISLKIFLSTHEMGR